MIQLRASVLVRTASLLAAATIGAAVVEAQSGPAAPASAAKAKELGELMKAKNLTVFASRDSAAPDRFVAVTYIPDVQILLVGAAYTRPSDIEYYMYKKDYQSAYQNLSSSTLAKDRFAVEDMIGDGLVAVPMKNNLPDVAVLAAGRTVFEGPADPKRRNDKRMAPDAYQKAFSEADARYASLLAELIAELKKG
jgi:hypothetical protein